MYEHMRAVVPYICTCTVYVLLCTPLVCLYIQSALEVALTLLSALCSALTVVEGTYMHTYIHTVHIHTLRGTLSEYHGLHAHECVCYCMHVGVAWPSRTVYTQCITIVLLYRR